MLVFQSCVFESILNLAKSLLDNPGRTLHLIGLLLLVVQSILKLLTLSQKLQFFLLFLLKILLQRVDQFLLVFELILNVLKNLCKTLVFLGPLLKLLLNLSVLSEHLLRVSLMKLVLFGQLFNELVSLLLLSLKILGLLLSLL